MSSSARENILKFLSLGLPQEAVAAKLNISPGLVSQIANEAEIKQKVTEAQLKFLDAATERDQKYNELEDALLEKAKKSLPSIFKPQDILRALTAINKAERRGATSQQMAEILNKKEQAIVEIDLPERIRTKIIKSRTQEIVEVNGRKLISKDSRLLYQEIQHEIENSKPLDPLDIELDTPLMEELNGIRAARPAQINKPLERESLPAPETKESVPFVAFKDLIGHSG